jgi:rfaE bifunctional protein nucleotidyltransferase chain/domain
MMQINQIEKKILAGDNLQRMLAFWQFKNKKIVFSNGCFDILHRGHIDYLANASDLGDVLIIGVNTDASVHRLKGTTRPINDEFARTLLLASLKFVSAVVLFDEDTPYELISKIQPDVLVKGDDYKPEDIVGYDIVKAKGGDIITIPLVEGYSTSSVEKRIIELHKLGK